MTPLNIQNRSGQWLTISLALLYLLGFSFVAPAQENSIQEAEALDQEIHKLYSEGHYNEAISSAQKSLAIRDKLLGSDSPDTITSLNNLASLYHATGAYAQAEPLFQQALAIQEQALGPNHPDTAMSLNNVALLYQATGAYSKAEPLLQRALAIREQALGLDHPETASSVMHLAHLAWATDKPASAIPLLKRAQAIHEKNRLGLLLSGSEARKQAYVQQLRGYTSANSSMSLALPDYSAVELGLTDVLQSKGRVLDAMSDSVARLRHSVNPKDRAILDELVAVVQQRATLTYQGIRDLTPEVYHQRLRDLVARQEQLESDLSTRSAEFLQQTAPITLERIKAALPGGAALIEWFRYQPFHPKGNDEKTKWGLPRYVAYVLRSDGGLTAIDVGEAEVIERLIHEFLTGLAKPDSAYVQDVAKELYDILLKPLQRHLDSVEHLLMSPDGALNLLPLAALVDETGTYVGSKKGITYLTSGRDLLKFNTASVAKGEAVIVADPDYGKSAPIVAKSGLTKQSRRSADFDRGTMDFQPLPGTTKEAKTLTTILKVSNAHVLTQAKATEDRFKQLHRPRILHVATHGFFLKDNELPTPTLSHGGLFQDKQPVYLSENPLLRSGLALAGANLRRSAEKEDGILTAAEVAQMDLRGTQLVVLTACETGVGDVQNGEGVYGLRRALVLAGAETQVTSLWKVADEATKDLMVDYYQRLLKGEGRSEALRNAQLTMMKSKDRSHPYYWAAFVPIGDWRPLAKRK